MAASGKMLGIVAGVVALILLVACGGLVFLNQQQAKEAAGLKDAFLKAASAAGIADLTPESLKDPAALQRVQDTITAQGQELATTKDALTTAGTEAANAKSEAAAQIQKAQEQAAQVAELTTQLAGKDGEITTAKAAADKAAQERQAAQQEAAKLKTDLDAATKKVQELEAAAAPAPTAEGAEAAAEGGATEAVEAAAEGAEEAAPAAPAEEPEPEGRGIGKSEMFRSIKYTAADQVLVLKLADGQKLTYKDVPEPVYGGMLNSADIDKYYRFKIQGVFSSTPEDKQAIRDFWRNINNRPVRGDLKVIE
ncbi:MAG TPA: KTSC domain-containing protein [Kiritimatiellia bacterium]|nr:KTSC domain-containing protein [Kiritimatiellia bacterium]HRZ11238.1 KTSC domain-containing protein [Kiritimatiellia bacterium]HSA19089.1 KTSC domain-containing protein [Kiritimatiellia bacterium]